MTIRKIASSAVIAAVYAALTMVLAPISYGSIQFRIAEALCILPFFFPASVWGLFIGCLIANLLSPYGLLDIIIGPIATLIAAIATMQLGKLPSSGTVRTKALACLPPVISNAVLVGAAITLASAASGARLPVFLVNALEVGAGELAVMFIIGLPLLILLPRSKWFRVFSESLGSHPR
ncbi:MAG: QueT transporter family protein [Oscillospiraceae bacterium]|nr:QueT transporter family protein [Oscillospiraceae bacterium]